MTRIQDPFGPPPLPAPARRRVTDEVPEDSAGRIADSALSAGLGVLGVAWVVLPPVLLLQAALDTWQLYGGPPSPSQVAASHRHLVLSCVLAVGLPLVGFVLARAGHTRLRRRRGAVRFFAATALLAAATTVGGVALDAASRSTPPPVPPRTYHCQELSGGGNECPGG